MNSIESNFVPYQIAVDMKSIGFDEPCFGYFNGKTITRIADDGTLSINKINTWRNTFLSYDNGKSCIPNESDFKQDLIANPEKYSRHKWSMTISAPLFQQAFRWFREKHNLYHFISNERNGNRFNACICTRFFPDKSRSFGGWSVECYVRTPEDYPQYDTFENPEEAELECLKKLIQTLKQN